MNGAVVKMLGHYDEYTGEYIPEDNDVAWEESMLTRDNFNKVKTQEEIDKDEQMFYKLQDEVLAATTIEERTKIAWKMYPIIESAMVAAVKQRAKHHYVFDLEDMVKDFSINLVSRMIKKPKKYEYFKAFIYWQSMNYYHPKYRDCLSIDEYTEKNGDNLSYEVDYQKDLD